MNRGDARARIADMLESFSFAEPLFYSALSSHQWFPAEHLETIRTGKGRIEYNQGFVDALSNDELRAVLSVEGLRILLAHPYQRRLPNPQWMLAASNLTVQEYLRTILPLPRARDLFDDESHDRHFYEFYYSRLAERSEEAPPSDDESSSTQEAPSGREFETPDDQSGESDSPHVENEDESDADAGQNTAASAGESADQTAQSNPPDDSSTDGPSDAAQQYGQVEQLAAENTQLWDDDEMRREEAVEWIREADANQRWGSLGPVGREQLRATLRPRLDYRKVLRQFRRSVRSQTRRRTRMKPSRRYGFDQLGSRYDTTTRILFAIDVSGSMSSEAISKGLSVINGFFHYSVESVDVIAFDSEVRGRLQTIRKRNLEFEIEGRGGTNFNCVFDFVQTHDRYDGIIIFTDGNAPVPSSHPQREPRLVWMFPTRQLMLEADAGFKQSGDLISIQDA